MTAEDRKTPSKPKPTTAPTDQLLAHYNSQVDAYNAAILEMDEKKRPETGLQVPGEYRSTDHGEFILFPTHPNPCCEQLDRDGLIELIRRQNHRLGRHIKARSHELLFEKVDDPATGQPLLKDGKWSVGHTYQHILDVLAAEFPEASTTVACLRWYVVHIRDDATREGSGWPPLPQVRPRSAAASKKGAAAKVQP
jgi:hypothetical protein